MSSTRIRRTSHSEIEAYDEFNSEDAFDRVVFNFIKPGKTWYEYQDPGKSVVVDDRSGKPDSHQLVIQIWIMTVLGFLKSRKVRLRHTIDQGNLIKLLGMKCNKVRPHHETLFSTEVRNP